MAWALLLLQTVAGQQVPAWPMQCLEKFEATRRNLAKSDPRLRHDTARLELRQHDLGKCEAFDRVTVSVRGNPQASVEVGRGRVYPLRSNGRWEETTLITSRSWTRKLEGKVGTIFISKDDLDAADEKFFTAFRSVIDECLAAAPSSHPPTDNPEWQTQCEERYKRNSALITACMNAKRAVRDIEEMCEYQSEAVGDGGGPGTTYLAVKVILKLGPDAMPIFQTLARSKNPVARMAATDGFRLLPSAASRQELMRLSSDTQVAPSLIGCEGMDRSVGDIAKMALSSR